MRGMHAEEIDDELSDAIEESLTQAACGEVLESDDVLARLRFQRETHLHDDR
jgi:predicted transcriptional regulator